MATPNATESSEVQCSAGAMIDPRDRIFESIAKALAIAILIQDARSLEKAVSNVAWACADLLFEAQDTVEKLPDADAVLQIDDCLAKAQALAVMLKSDPRVELQWSNVAWVCAGHIDEAQSALKQLREGGHAPRAQAALP